MNDITSLQQICKQIRYHILTSTTQAGSGHPTSCLSAVELMATLFFGGFLKYDIRNPHSILNDRVIFSKGHAAPLLYALWTVAGAISKEEMLTLRQFGSRLEGHPTPAFPYVDVATGSLGQGLSVGVGMAFGLRLLIQKKEILLKREPTIWVLLGDSEIAEGQIWEALETASFYNLNNIVGVLDINRLGQSGETEHAWNVNLYKNRIESFGWHTIVLKNGHNLEDIQKAFTHANKLNTVRLQKPIMILARTVKGKGVALLEDKEDWHGKVLSKKQLSQALKALSPINLISKGKITLPQTQKTNFKFQQHNKKIKSITHRLASFIPNQPTTKYSLPTATRQAFGDTLAQLGEENENIVVLDAEVGNSTYTDIFGKKFPERFFQMFIDEENMVSVALGLSKIGFIPYLSTFAAFLTRAFDQIRMAQYSFVGGKSLRDPESAEQSEHWREKNFWQDPQYSINIVGSHSGCSIGQDGPSQMGLEDISMMRSIRESTVLYPSDAYSTVKLTSLLVHNPGISYLRLTREKTPVIYNEREEFMIGGCKVHYANRESRNVKRLTLENESIETLHATRYTLHALIIAAGITLHEALKAQKQLLEKGIEVVVVDLYSIKPLDEKTILKLAKQTNHIVVVEDHYPAGGIGEAVLSSLSTNHQLLTTNYRYTHLCVRKLPHSGTPEELLRYEEIDAEAIINVILSHI